MVIADLADSEAALLATVESLRARVASLEADRYWYREMVLSALDAFRQLEEARDMVRRLREELRTAVTQDAR